MADYPKTHQEFLDFFQTETDCLEYLFAIRWSGGYVCPICKHNKAWKNRRNLYQCAKCEYECSIIAGTIFQGTRKPLKLWFNVIWHIVSQKTGASAQNLKESMGFGSYQTTWSWLHKLRRAMIRPGRDKLQGIIEIDETFIGGMHEGKRGRGANGKTLVVVATECLGKKCGRVRFQCIPVASEECLLAFINDYIEPGSQIITDGWVGYVNIDTSKFEHEIRVIKGSGKQAHDLLPHVHLVDSLLKRWINGTHQGNIDPYHLPYYLDEFAFRFNRRLSSYRGKLFYRLIQQSLTTQPVSYKELTKSHSISNKALQDKLAEVTNKESCSVWTASTVNKLEPIVEQCVRNLAKLDPIKYIKITNNSIMASDQVTGNRIKTPVTKPNHPSAIGIYVFFDMDLKTVEFYEINSATKGWGGLMVAAILNDLSKEWRPTLVFDYSNGFWAKMEDKYSQLNWLRA